MPTSMERQKQNKDQAIVRQNSQGDTTSAQNAQGASAKGQAAKSPSPAVRRDDEPGSAGASVPQSDHLLPGEGRAHPAAQTGPLSPPPAPAVRSHAGRTAAAAESGKPSRPSKTR